MGCLLMAGKIIFSLSMNQFQPGQTMVWNVGIYKRSVDSVHLKQAN